MLGSGDVWDIARQCEQVLAAQNLPHAIVGGVAVCLHGYQRNTVDVDMLVRSEDAPAVRAALEDIGFAWIGNVPVQFLMAREPAGHGASLPDPAEPGVTTQIEGLTVLTLARLIETKIACGLSNLRRTHRDLADVVELIARHNLGRDFAPHLHKEVRKEYRELVQRARAT